MANKAHDVEAGHALDLTSSEAPARSTIVLRDGSRCAMRGVDEFSLAELEELQELWSGHSGIDDIQQALKMILVDATDEQVGSLTGSDARQIAEFFNAQGTTTIQLNAPAPSSHLTH